MRPETRNNLIFLTILLILMAPGAIILFNKKSVPGARPVGSPDPVRRTTAYMDPYPPDTTPRLAPIKTLEWVATLAQDATPSPATLLSRPTTSPTTTRIEGPKGGSGNVGVVASFPPLDVGPLDALILSDTGWFQVLSRGTTPDGTPWVRILLWDEDATPDRLSATADAAPAPLLASRTLDLPKTIRHNLQDAGLVLPPNRILLLDLQLPPTAQTLTLSLTGKHPRTESTRLP